MKFNETTTTTKLSGKPLTFEDLQKAIETLPKADMRPYIIAWCKAKWLRYGGHFGFSKEHIEAVDKDPSGIKYLGRTHGSFDCYITSQQDMIAIPKEKFNL